MFSANQTRLNIPRAQGCPSSMPPQYHDTHTYSDFDTTYSGHGISQSCTSTTKEKTSLDLTQRIERKLAEYNASQNVFKRWLFELASWCISASCMVAIIVIYSRIKDQEFLEGDSYLNWINVLGKVASAALIVPTSEALGQLKWNWFHKSKAMWDFEIFDKASRGPWGALMLLFRTRGRSLAALGALLVVLLLAIDTFFQQVSDMPERWALQIKGGKVPLTVRYAPYLGGNVFRENATVTAIDDDMSVLVHKYSYGNGTQSVPIGNGTRPDIPLVCISTVLFCPLYRRNVANWI